MAGVLIGIYLAKIGFTAAATGAVVTAGLAGGALGALVVTLTSDRWGRRRTLIALALLGAAGGFAVAAASGILLIGAAAFIGMLNGMGRDRGGALIVDQAVLPATAADHERTQVFAWYNVLQDAGHALGGVLAATPTLLVAAGVAEVTAFRFSMAGYAALLLATAAIATLLSPAIEHVGSATRAPVTPETRRIL